MFRAIRHIGRLLKIARTLARHDALFLLDRLGVAPAVSLAARLVSRGRSKGRDGERLAAALEELGPSFIKLGQAMSTRADLLGDQMTADLAKLQDRLPPFPGAAARATIERELGMAVEECFESFDDVPVAAASIAQVHFAITTEGREVAVKILRPGIEDAFGRDLDLFYWIAEIVERTQPSFRRLKPVEVVRTFAETVALEMDLRYEAAAASELRENFEGDPYFIVPEVDWARTSRRVMTLERIAGTPVGDVEALVAAGQDLDAILEKAASAFFNQVFRDGFFHADMHPGNLFIDDDGNLVAVDFGIMGRLDRKTRYFLAEMLIGFLTGDYRGVAEVHFRAGYVPTDKSVDAFTQACRSIGEPLLGRPLHEISLARLLGQLFEVTEVFEMETQPQLLLLQKTMLLAEGMGRRLNPEINMWELARPLIEDWIRDNLGPEARLRDAADDFRGAVERLPAFLAEADRALQMFGDGGLRLHPESVRALRGGRNSAALLWPLWLAVALLAVITIAVL
ncbi:MAG: 2-polyprenylphenol 6-hydroxylase [Alphaproteobacteria bacterium]|nr:2-polyprenylphenol 6-hydroxylase [Alphaproteobacteria bacterium]